LPVFVKASSSHNTLQTTDKIHLTQGPPVGQKLCGGLETPGISKKSKKFLKVILKFLAFHAAYREDGTNLKKPTVEPLLCAVIFQ